MPLASRTVPWLFSTNFCQNNLHLFGSVCFCTVNFIVTHEVTATYWDTCKYQLPGDLLSHSYYTLWVMITNFQGIYRDIQIVLHFLTVCNVLFGIVQNNIASNHILLISDIKS